MKYKFLIALLSLMMVSACAKQEQAPIEKPVAEKEVQEEFSPETEKQDPVEVKEDEEVVEEKETDSIENPSEENNETPAVFNEDQFIIDTFASYGYTVPNRSQWIVKQEGPNKTAVTIKENLNQKGKPDISKLIFLRNGNETEILHLVVKNKVII